MLSVPHRRQRGDYLQPENPGAPIEDSHLPGLASTKAARAINGAYYPSDEWAPLPFDEAERYGTVHYRQAVDGALAAHACLTAAGEQLNCMLHRTDSKVPK